MALSTETKKQLESLAKANAALERDLLKAQGDLIKAFRRAELAMMQRVTQLVATGPNFSTTQLQARLAWYFQNIPSSEIGQMQAQYGRAVTSYLDKYPRIGNLASSVIDAGARIPSDLTRMPPELIKALRGRDVAFFNELNQQALNRLDRNLLDSVIVGRTPVGALESIRGTITGSYPWGQRRGLYEWHAGTYARTANVRFSRQILKEKADELKLENFVYIGPVGKNRPFCAGIIGGAFTRVEIDDMDNNQTGDVFSDGGGFNCRHTWSPVDKAFFDALKKEDGTGEVQKQLEKTLPKPKPPVAAQPASPTNIGGKPPVNPQGWTPAKTIEEATKWARDRNIANEVNFGKLHVDVANEMNRRLAAHLERWPKLREIMDFYGSTQGRRQYLFNQLYPAQLKKAQQIFANAKADPNSFDVFRIRGFKDADALARKYTQKLLNKEKASGEYGAQWPGRTITTADGTTKTNVGRGIATNEKWGARGTTKVDEYIRNKDTGIVEYKRTTRPKVDAWRDQLKKDGVSKWHPEGADDIAAYVDHEIGHALDVMVGGAGRETYGISRRQFLHDLYNKHRAGGTMKEQLSQYALKKYRWSNDPLEMLAEAWSEFLNSPAPRALAREIGEEVLKILAVAQ